MKHFIRRQFYSLFTAALAIATYALCALVSVSPQLSRAGYGAGEIRDAQAQSAQVASALQAYPEGIDVGNNWLWNPGYGFMYVGSWPWVYNELSHFWYYGEGNAYEQWAYVDLAWAGKHWCYTRQDLYPWIYISTFNKWGYMQYVDDWSGYAQSGVSEIQEAGDNSPEPGGTNSNNNDGETPNEDIDPSIDVSPAGG